MAAKEYKKYSDVPKKYRFDLEFLLEGKTKEQALKNVIKIFKQYIETKDSKFESKEAYLKALKLNDKLEREAGKLFNYMQNTMAVNVVDKDMKVFMDTAEFEFYKLNQELGPEEPRFFKHSKKIKVWMKDKSFAPYRKNINELLEDEKHQLPKAIQEFRTKESRADISSHEIFSILTNSELVFKDAKTSKGKKVIVNQANRAVLAKHKDPMVRKTSFISYRDAYLQHKQSLANMLYQHFKRATVWSKLTKFNKTIDHLLYSDRVPEEMLLNLYTEVKEGNKLFKKYDSNWKKFYKAKFKVNPTKYDKSVKLVDVKADYTVEEAIKTVKEAIKPFGKEYTEVAGKALKENWVDFMPVKNKRTGAYSIGATYGIDKKLINMNFDGTFRSVETLAHELGHSMHSYFADKNQPQQMSQYPIFVAEIASIFNELILFDHMLKTSDNDKLKFDILTSMIDGFRGTVVRQASWSNFEYDMYKAIETGQPVSTYEAMAKIYNDNDIKYSNSKKPRKPEDAFMGIMVPHFYADFYVYKYVVGQLCANIFFQKYKEEGPKALQFYIDKFLSSGDRDWPLNVLKDAGIDLMKPDSYKLGFKALEKNISEWTKLGNKIFKIK